MTKKGLYEPPQLAIRLFRWYCRRDRREELEGDLEEFFYLRKSEGQPLWKAQLFFWWNVLRCYRSYSRTQNQRTMTYYPLFKSYFKLAIRHSWKNKWSVLINIVGLGVALSMCIFVYSIYAHNIEFDSFYKDTDNLYRVNSMTFENGQERRNELSPYAMDQILRNEIGSISQVSGYADYKMNVKQGKEYFEESVGIASRDFFEMFDIPLWYGSLAEFGNKPVVYLSKPTAKKYFGKEVGMGEQLTIYINSTSKLDVTVAGVFDRIPLNSSFDFNMLICQNDYVSTVSLEPNDWGNKRYLSHYIRTDAKNIEAIVDHMSGYIPQQNDGHEELKVSSFELVPFISEIHSNGNMYRNNTNIRLDASIYIIFTSLAGMVFLIACFNLANSSIAMIAKRLKEIGIRKTLGSQNKQILVQFLMEMGIVCGLAFIVGLSMINYTSSAIMGLFGETFLIKDISPYGVMTFIVIFLVFTTLVAGIMPALYAWKFQPVAIMRKSVKLKGVDWINKSLVVAQYAFSIAVLSAAISFSQNQTFLENLDLGYANENIYALSLADQELYPAISQQVEQMSGVEIAGTFNHVQSFGRSSVRKVLEIDTASFELTSYVVGKNYLELMEIPVILGRSFRQGNQADQKGAVIVNEAFSAQYFSSADPINQVVKIDGERKTIIGVYANVIHDVYSDSEDEPAAFLYNESDTYRYLIAKVNGGKKSAFEAQIKEIWSAQADGPYKGNWQKDLAYGSAVSDTENLRIIFMAMAILGGLLSIAGIFSLSRLNVAKRIKEISVRKVLGSSFKQLLLSVNRSFIVILSVSVVVGSILGFLISDMVLGMVYTIYVPITPFTSMLSGISLLIFALTIITLSTLRPVRANPILGLREE